MFSMFIVNCRLFVDFTVRSALSPSAHSSSHTFTALLHSFRSPPTTATNNSHCITPVRCDIMSFPPSASAIAASAPSPAAHDPPGGADLSVSDRDTCVRCCCVRQWCVDHRLTLYHSVSLC